MTTTNPLLKKLLKRNAKSRGKTPISLESLHAMAQATHGRFDNVEIKVKNGRPLMICRGLVTWHPHNPKTGSLPNGKDTTRTA